MSIQIMYEMYEKHAEYMSNTENKVFTLNRFISYDSKNLKLLEGICDEES